MSSAWILYYAAAQQFDGLADNTSLDNLQELGVKSNVAIGLMLSAGALLADIVDPVTSQSVQAVFHEATLTMSWGQHTALTATELTLPECWRLAEQRSGVFFAAACRAGARCGTCDEDRLAALEIFGLQLGVLMQIGDDFWELWPGQGRASDLVASSRWTLPIAYAMTVLPPEEQGQLRALLAVAKEDAQAEAAARDRILACGAGLYLAVEAECRRAAAAKTLSDALPASPARAALLELLEVIASRCTP